MAFYDDEDELEEGGPQQLSAESGAIGSGGATSGAPGGADAPKNSDNFVGISQYLDANKPQSEKLAGQVAGKIGEKVQGFESALSGAQSSFDKAADAGKVAADQGILSQVQSDASKLGDEQKGSFAKMRDASYGGPTSLDQTEAWGGLQAALKGAQGAQQAASNEEGRMGLIKEVSNNPRQSQGALTFDNLLLQSNPNSAAKLQQAAAPIGSFESRVNAAGEAAGQKAAGIKSENEKTKAAAADALKKGYANLGTDLASREAVKDAEQKKEFSTLQKLLSMGGADNEFLSKIGLTRDLNTYGVNAGDYLSYVDGADKNSVATQEDMARQAVLRELAGAGIDLGAPLIEGAIGQTQNPYAFDNKGFESAVSSAGSEYQQQAQNLQSQIDQAWATYNSRNVSDKTAAAASRKAHALLAQLAELQKRSSANAKVGSNLLVPGVGPQLAGPQRIGV